MTSAHSCPACDLVHGKGNGGWLHPSTAHPPLLMCNYCGRYYHFAGLKLIRIFSPAAYLASGAFGVLGRTGKPL